MVYDHDSRLCIVPPPLHVPPNFAAQDPKYRSLSTSSKVYTDVLLDHPPMVEVLRLAGFRHKGGDETHLTLMHR